MTEKRPLRFGLLKGKVTVRHDFDHPMTLVEFLGESPSPPSVSSAPASHPESEQLRGADEAMKRDD